MKNGRAFFKKNRLYLLAMGVAAALTMSFLSLRATQARYIFTLPRESFDVETADFDLNHTGALKTMVYHTDSQVSFQVSNTKADSNKVSSRNLRYRISIHSGDGVHPPDLQNPNKNFILVINGKKQGQEDQSAVFTLRGGRPLIEELGLSFLWDAADPMPISEFVYVKIAVLSPYEKEYVFPVIILGKRLIQLEALDGTDPFQNTLKTLHILTAHSFGAGEAEQTMIVKLTWDPSLKIDDTNPLLLSQPNWQTGKNEALLMLKPATECDIHFYAGQGGRIKAESWVRGVDFPYYGEWDSARADLSGWAEAPDGNVPAP